MLKKDDNISRDRTTIWVSFLIILERLFTGKKPPDEIKENERFNESNDLIEKIFKIIKINNVKNEYKRKILIACLNISELLNEIKFVNDFFKLSS